MRKFEDIKDFMSSLTPDQIQDGNRKQEAENKEMYLEFSDAYSKGCCFLCGNKLDYFSPYETCFHWFIKPSEIRKKHFNDYLSEDIGFFKLESYFRWLANIEKPFRNINDLKCETSESKLLETTIKYKNIEWTVTYGKSDLEGHKDSKNANFPHFHLQMLVDGLPFIRFNDFHIPFSKEDLFNIELLKEENVLFRNSQAPGMTDILEDSEMLEMIDEHLTVAESEEDASLNFDTMIQMPEGKTMSSDEIAEIFEVSKRTKKPIRHLMKERFPEAGIQSIVTPANGVPEKKKRKKR
jgi:hypothetical protein